jgi:hypothetical protein
MATSISGMQTDRPPARYRCTACGNLTRFEVTMTRRTRAFHHFTIGGELSIEDTEVLSEDVESVECRWCGTSASVVQVDPDELDADARPQDAAGTDDAARADAESPAGA